jgi:ATP-binding cassette subfamily C (CFTR/MRP) protein 1
MVTHIPSSCSKVDSTFGPYAGHCRGGFDFTLLFEETILTILPLVAIIAVAPFRLYYLFKKDTKVGQSIILPTKLVCHSVHPDIILCRANIL